MQTTGRSAGWIMHISHGEEAGSCQRGGRRGEVGSQLIFIALSSFYCMSTEQSKQYTGVSFKIDLKP